MIGVANMTRVKRSSRDMPAKPVSDPSSNSSADLTQANESYFGVRLPWQDLVWKQFLGQHQAGRLPHGLLLAGKKGIGKHTFLWQAVAYLLCQAPIDATDGQSRACGVCPSCHWLKVGNHPDLLVLPSASLPGAHENADDHERIKIDEVRALQEFVHRQSQGLRLVVLDHADSLTVAAANALLKTLEEPRAGVYLWLVTDHPSRLMPTIKSRLQALPIAHIDSAVACDYVAKMLAVDNSTAGQLLSLSDFAPLDAVALPSQAWFGLRGLWLKTLGSLQTGTRSATQASLYWQEVLDFDSFVSLS